MSFLADLPAAGNFNKFKPAAHQYIPKYVCDHETAPLNGSVKSDDTNILIRSLNKKKRNIQPPPDAPMKQNDHKRAATEITGEKATASSSSSWESSSSSNTTSTSSTTTTSSNSNTTDDSRLKRLRLNGDSNSTTTTTTTTTLTQESLEAMTKTQLVTLCKQKNLSTAGNKDQLVERILKSTK